MLLPVQYAWFEPVLIATIVVFIIDLIGYSIGFGNRFLSAFMALAASATMFCVAGERLRTVMSSIMGRRRGLISAIGGLLS